MTQLRAHMHASARAALVATLCTTLAAPAAFATDVPQAATHTAPLTHSERTLHALNRLTFGPRPGDEAAVTKEGLDAWFKQQLHPESIDDSAFEKRLADFPAMQLSTDQLIERYPGPLLLRGMLSRGQDTFNFKDPVENAIYADAVARYKVGLQIQALGGKKGDSGKLDADDMSKVGQANKPVAVAGDNMAAMQQGSMDGDMAGKPAAARGKAAGTTNKLDASTFTKLPPSTLSATDIQAIVAMEPQARFDRIVAMSPQDNIKFAYSTANRIQDVMQGWMPEQREAYAAMQSPQRVVATETLGERILRDTYSDRQLQAVMTDFWLNHFSVYVKKNGFMPWLLNGYERDAILPNALGNFEQMLIATAKSPAMLMYLDNWESVGDHSQQSQRLDKFAQYAKGNAKAAEYLAKAPKGINENYARELMELHTVGVNGGYTQKDVIEVAKCFTGWTVNRPYGTKGGSGDNGAGPQAFIFDPSKHEPGPKTVMGVTIPEGGMQEGLTVLHMLANSPQTAHFVSEKLAVRFVADTPPKAIVDAMAATFLKTHGDIKSVLTTMYQSPDFWSPKVYRAKVKTPIEFMVSALRASGTSIQTPILLIQAADQLGMPIYGMQTPQGYSWKSEDWVSSGALVNRMNFALVLSGDQVRGAQTNWSKVLGDPSQAMEPTAETEKKLETLILGEPASARTRATVLDQFKNTGIQQAAAQNFNLHEAPADDSDGGGTMAAAGSGASPRQKLLAAYQKKNGGGSGNGGFSFQSKGPETPLDTMAGLLIGSPDFQRR